MVHKEALLGSMMAAYALCSAKQFLHFIHIAVTLLDVRLQDRYLTCATVFHNKQLQCTALAGWEEEAHHMVELVSPADAMVEPGQVFRLIQDCHICLHIC